MWWKTIACSFVIISTQILGISYGKDLKCTLYHLSQQKKMLLYMMGEIQYLHRPMIEILAGMKNIVEEPYVSFIHSVIEEMEHEKSLKDSWLLQAKGLEDSHCYPECAIKYLYDYPGLFVYNASRTQLEALQLFLKGIEEKIEEIKEQKKSHARIFYLLSSLLGVFIIILFI